MGDKQDTERAEYIKWSKSVTRLSKIFIAGICVLIFSFASGLKFLDVTPAVFWASIIAIFLWCGCGYLILHKK